MKYLKKLFALDPQFIYFLLILTTVVYAFSWGGEFLSDDIAGIQYNPNISDFFLQLKTLNINNIYNSTILNIFGVKPFWFHLSNTIFHLMAVVVVYIFIHKLSKTLWVTRLTTLLFAIHPIETEGVAWISGLSYATYTLLFIISLTFYLVAFQAIKNTTDRLKYLSCANVFLILSLSSSEKAVIYPAILIAMLVFFIRPFTKINIFSTIPAFIISGIYTLSRISDVSARLGNVNPGYTGESVAFDPLVQIPIAIYSYIKLILIPFNLTLYHEFNSFPQWEYALAVIVTIITLAIIIASSYYALKKQRPLVALIPFGLIFFISSLALTLLPINIAWGGGEKKKKHCSIFFFFFFNIKKNLNTYQIYIY